MGNWTIAQLYPNGHKPATNSRALHENFVQLTSIANRSSLSRWSCYREEPRQIMQEKQSTWREKRERWNLFLKSGRSRGIRLLEKGSEGGNSLLELLLLPELLLQFLQLLSQAILGRWRLHYPLFSLIRSRWISLRRRRRRLESIRGSVVNLWWIFLAQEATQIGKTGKVTRRVHKTLSAICLNFTLPLVV